ncbi:thioredoxin family protein [Candidatus Shapirobacteria bacterium]|nr:thioredoxin family protein [Candidatus Shapirobacteria bacterium]
MKVIKIGAVWCPGCLVMRARWKKIEKENPWLKTEYFDYDADQEKIAEFEIKGEKLPVFIFLSKDKKEFLRLHGEPSKKELVRIILENRDK